MRPLPGPPQGLPGLALSGVTAKAWPWEISSLGDLLSWLGAMMWEDEVDTLTFLELAMDFEAHSKRSLPAAPQAEFGLMNPAHQWDPHRSETVI